ncbi:TonB-dependent receptor [Catalinimonas alkaloidigena]|uniref:TonB-dependent receptor n=1 Tax=Catalinimonas alkaloidigena TaxID=1075417 RepID=UPI0024073E20|nr:TonB-dependent receptor [Catalinimonas alkaloidigena]
MSTRFVAYGVLLQLLCFQLLIAADGEAQNIRNVKEVMISVDYQETTLNEVFRGIESKTEFKFVYDQQDIPLQDKVSFTLTNQSLADVLVEVSRISRLSFKQVNNTINVRRLKNKRTDKPIEVIIEQTISGKVSDSESGEPLPGVNVLAKGTTTGTVTGVDGNYRLTVSDEVTTLVFSSIGYLSQEIQINGRASIDISMNADVQSLEEIVVVGYGVQQKVNLTGAISTVNFDEELENRPITNASQALGGTASGIWVSQNSGKPGDDGAQLRVRGWGTLNNSNPLVIVDGVEGSFDQLNPNDIESISVLKDAASAAIYGSKAANGVILVTTKMGKLNEKMQVNINSYAGVQSLGRRYDVVSNSAEHMELSNQALINEGASPLFSDELITAFRNGGDPYKYPNTDWFNELFQTSPIHEHNISVRGGSSQLSSFLSFNYLDQEGMVPNTSSRRYGLRANLESSVNDWLTLGGRINYIRRDSNEPYADVTYGSLGRVFEMLGGATPYIAPFTRDGRFGSVQAIDQDGNLLYDNRNPLIDAANGLTKTEENILTLNATADIRLNDDFMLKTTFASNNEWRLIDKHNTSVFGYTDTGIETITKNYNREGLEINRDHVSMTNNNLFTTLNYNKNIAETHDVSAIVGIQLETNKIQDVFARRSAPPKEGLTQVDAGTSGIQGTGNMEGLRIFSYFGRVNYALLNKYLFEVNLRADASSRFRDGNRWGVFPGFSAGWRLSEEEFIQNMDVFSNLKLRASWGQLGNQNISGFWPYLTVIEQNNNLSYNYNGSFAPGAAVTSLVDQNISWETTSTLDIGIDIGLLEDRINIEADYFQKTTEDIIVQLPIPQILGGLAAPYENVGEMSNDGFEFIINYSNLRLEKDQLGFNVGFNLTYINNEVTKFRGGDSPDQLYLIREGYSYRTLYGFNATGIYQTDDEALEHMHSNSFTPVAGNLKYEDLNNDGRLTFEDRQALGNTLPKLTLGFSPSFRYRGFDLNLLFQGIGGVNMYTQNNFTTVTWENRVLSTRWRDAWTPENTDTDVPSIKFNNSWDTQPSSYWVQDLNFLKLKNVQLGYTFPEELTSRLGLEKIYFYANGQNVFTLVSDDYEGYDPERSTFNSGYNIYPVPRIVSFGVNLNF